MSEHAARPKPTPKSAPHHRRIVVFIPAYEASLLYDSYVRSPNVPPPLIWGSVDGLRKANLYGALRLPTPLVPKCMLKAGPIEVYKPFVQFLTRPTSRFAPFQEGVDFFHHSYDWRQDLLSVLVPQLAEALHRYTEIYKEACPHSASDPEIIIVAHSMGGLLVRTLLQLQPEWAERISRFFMLGTPNRGSIKAVKTLAVGPGGLRENELRFPVSLLRWLPNQVTLALTQLVAITRPSLYYLLPQDDPHWIVPNLSSSKRPHRFGAEDLLHLATWRHFWPSAELENELFLKPWLEREHDAGRPLRPRHEYEYCQDEHLPKLKKMLHDVTKWRKLLGPVSTTDAALTRPGEPSRLWAVTGTQLKTPRGFQLNGKPLPIADANFHDYSDGDETVTSSSVLDDLDPRAANVLQLPKVSHGQMVNSPIFWDKLAHFLRS